MSAALFAVRHALLLFDSAAVDLSLSIFFPGNFLSGLLWQTNIHQCHVKLRFFSVAC